MLLWIFLKNTQAQNIFAENKLQSIKINHNQPKLQF